MSFSTHAHHVSQKRLCIHEEVLRSLVPLPAAVAYRAADHPATVCAIASRAAAPHTTTCCAAACHTPCCGPSNRHRRCCHCRLSFHCAATARRCPSCCHLATACCVAIVCRAYGTLPYAMSLSYLLPKSSGVRAQAGAREGVRQCACAPERGVA